MLHEQISTGGVVRLLELSATKQTIWYQTELQWEDTTQILVLIVLQQPYWSHCQTPLITFQSPYFIFSARNLALNDWLSFNFHKICQILLLFFYFEWFSMLSILLKIAGDTANFILHHRKKSWYPNIGSRWSFALVW